MLMDIPIGNMQDFYSQIFQIFFSFQIVCHCFRMAVSIQFNGKLQLGTVEIHNIRPDDLLT